jgi:hypothetical protein
VNDHDSTITLSLLSQTPATKEVFVTSVLDPPRWRRLELGSDRTHLLFKLGTTTLYAKLFPYHPPQSHLLALSLRTLLPSYHFELQSTVRHHTFGTQNPHLTKRYTTIQSKYKFFLSPTPIHRLDSTRLEYSAFIYITSSRCTKHTSAPSGAASPRVIALPQTFYTIISHQIRGLYF